MQQIILIRKNSAPQTNITPGEGGGRELEVRIKDKHKPFGQDKLRLSGFHPDEIGFAFHWAGIQQGMQDLTDVCSWLSGKKPRNPICQCKRRC